MFILFAASSVCAAAKICNVEGTACRALRDERPSSRGYYAAGEGFAAMEMALGPPDEAR